MTPHQDRMILNRISNYHMIKRSFEVDGVYI